MTLFPVGTTILVTTGCYSDEQNLALVKVLKAFDHQVIFAQHKAEWKQDPERPWAGYDDTDTSELLEWLFQEGYVEDIVVPEWHLSDYSYLDPTESRVNTISGKAGHWQCERCGSFGRWWDHHERNLCQVCADKEP